MKKADYIRNITNRQYSARGAYASARNVGKFSVWV